MDVPIHTHMYAPNTCTEKKNNTENQKKPNNKILENQDQYSGVFAQSSKVVWPQVTKAPGKDLRLEKKQQCKQLA